MRWLPKVVYGIICTFLAIVFFLRYGTEPIQFYFAFPLYLLLGIELSYTQKELYEMVLAVADGSMEYEDMLKWILEHQA